MVGVAGGVFLAGFTEIDSASSKAEVGLGNFSTENILER